MPDEISTGDTESPQPITKNLHSFLIGRSSGIEFGLDLTETRGVSTFGRIIPIPGTAPSIIGLTYFRGGIEAAIDLGLVWSNSSALITSESRAVLIEVEGRRAVLVVDSLLDLFDCGPNDLRIDEGKYRLTGQIGEIRKDGSQVPLISAALFLQSIG